MRNHVVRLLVVLLLVPSVLLFATAEGAQAAANPNPWHGTELDFGRAIAGDVKCSLYSRYTVTGFGVEWKDSPCVDGVDPGLPLSDVPVPEAGSHWSLTVKGRRTGYAGDPNQTSWVGTNNCGGTTLAGVLRVDCQVPASPYNSQSFWITTPNSDAYGNMCVRFTNGAGPYTQNQVFAGIPEFGGAGTKSFGFANGDSNLKGATGFDAWFIAKGVSSCGTGATHGTVVMAADWAPPTPTSPVGYGEGDYCSGSASGDMVASPDDQWFHRSGVLPAGALNVTDTGKGFCTVIDVCLALYSGDATPGLSADHYSEYHEECVAVAFDAPVVGTDTSTEADTPVPGHTFTPTADTDKSFWDQMLGAMQGLIRSLVNGLSAVVDAVTGVAGAILDGLGSVLTSLFVPSDGFLDGQVTAVKDAWADTAPGQVVGTLAGLPGKITPPASQGCDGVALTVHGVDVGNRPDGPGSTVLHPFSTCSAATAKLADIVKVALQCMIAVATAFASFRIIGAAFGLSGAVGGDGA